MLGDCILFSFLVSFILPTPSFLLSFPFFLVPLSLSPSGFRPFISLLYPPSPHFADWCRFLPTRSMNGVCVTPPLAMTLYTACLAHLPKFCGCINPVCPSECSIYSCILQILIFFYIKMTTLLQPGFSNPLSHSSSSDCKEPFLQQFRSQVLLSRSFEIRSSTGKTKVLPSIIASESLLRLLQGNVFTF